jgi:hypothetical protein
VLSLRQSQLLHEQDSAPASANAGHARSQRFAVGPVASAGTRRIGVRAAVSREFHDFPSGCFALARGGAPALSAELLVADLIFALLRP